jgi:putative RecB family exonuclease
MSKTWNGYDDVEGWKDKISTLIYDEEKLRTFRWQAWWCVENLWKIEDPNVVEVSEIEHELNGSISGVKMKGFIDRYLFDGNNITISDYKTGKTPKKQYVADKFTQLIIYSSLLLDEMEDRFIVKPEPTIELLYLKDGVRFSKKVKHEDIEEMSVGIKKTKTQIDLACKTGRFDPNPTMLCNWCGYKTICPAWVK